MWSQKRSSSSSHDLWYCADGPRPRATLFSLCTGVKENGEETADLKGCLNTICGSTCSTSILRKSIKSIKKIRLSGQKINLIYQGSDNHRHLYGELKKKKKIRLKFFGGNNYGQVRVTRAIQNTGISTSLLTKSLMKIF